MILKELEVFLESPEKKQARLEKIEAKKREEEKLRIEAEKNIETVGKKLRNMMPWITSNKLVDTDKN